MWQRTIGGVPERRERVSDAAVLTASYSWGDPDQKAAVSSVSTRAPASSSASRRYGPW